MGWPFLKHTLCSDSRGTVQAQGGHKGGLLPRIQPNFGGVCLVATDEDISQQ